MITIIANKLKSITGKTSMQVHRRSEALPLARGAILVLGVGAQTYIIEAASDIVEVVVSLSRVYIGSSLHFMNTV